MKTMIVLELKSITVRGLEHGHAGAKHTQVPVFAELTFWRRKIDVQVEK